MIPIESIVSRTADYYSLSLTEIKGPSRSRVLTQARHIAMTVCRRMGHTYADIARYFNRACASVSEAVLTVENKTDHESPLEQVLQRLAA